MMDISSAIYSLIFLLLAILFMISFALFVRRLLINSSIKSKGTSDIATKLDKIIEQNEKIISLNKEK